MVPNLPPLLRYLGFSRDVANFERIKHATLVITYISYTTFHLSEQPFSIVKKELHPNCNTSRTTALPAMQDDEACSAFPPFDGDDYGALLGALDYANLVGIAIGIFVSGVVAERNSLRTFLTWSMMLTGVFVSLFGVGYFADIHVFGNISERTLSLHSTRTLLYSL